jgi:hypothetical protein
MLEVLGIKNIGKLVPSAEDHKPKDPVSENMNILNGKPVKAFIYQDHEAHIAVHKAAMDDPKMAALIGQNPQANTIMAAAMAHINEHIAFQYRIEIEKMLGVPLPEMDKELPKEMEVEVSRMMAAAAAKLLQKDQAEAAQQQAQQAAQDPLVQMQQKEIEIKEREVGIKEQKLQIDAMTNAQRLAIERERIASQEQIAGLQVGAKISHAQEELNAKMELEGVKIGAENARNMRQEQRPVIPTKE